MELFDVLLVGAFDALLLGEPQIYISSASLFLPSQFSIKTTRVHGVQHILLSKGLLLYALTSTHTIQALLRLY